MKIITRLATLALGLAAVVSSAWADVPFTPTTITDGQFAADTKWYTLGIGASKLRIYNNDGADYIQLGGYTTSADENKWCFVGDETNGFKIYNKEAGTTMALAAPSTITSSNDGTAYAILRSTESLGSSYSNLWDFNEATTVSSGTLSVTGGYYVNVHGQSTYRLNNRDSKLAFWVSGYDNGSVITITPINTDITVDLSNGSFTSTNSAGTYASVWTSTATDPQLTLSCGANNMSANGTNINIASGSAASSTYSLTAGSSYIITGYSFKFKNAASNSNTTTLTANGTTYTVSDTEQTVSVSGLEDITASFVLAGNNHSVVLTDFTVNISISMEEPEPQTDLMISTGTPNYRIPAIATAYNGDVIAMADYRYTGADIGSGKLDLRYSISKDNGATWGDIQTLVKGEDYAVGSTNATDFMHVGFGDPCIVADRESNRVLVLCCTGDVYFQSATRDDHQGIARFYGTYDETSGSWSWSDPDEISETIYTQFDASTEGTPKSMFIGSGRIFQSSTVKVGEYYRLYCSVLYKDVSNVYKNYVLYSDDFGGTWSVLGGVNTPAITGGDEPKAEELPDGSVLCSSRMNGGRYYNIFHFTDVKTAAGSWGTMATSNSSSNGVIASSNSTNGEVMVLPVKRVSDNKEMYLILQSVPIGPNRTNVGIYYKALESLADFTDATSLSADWDGVHQASYMGSAYSTMTLQADHSIGFLYEESTYGYDYTIVYKNYSIEDITDDAYTYSTSHIYTVVASGLSSTDGVTVTDASGKQTAVGDYAVYTTVPDASSFTASEVDGYEGKVSVSGRTITLTYTLLSYPLLSTVDGKEYEYYVRCAGSNSGYYVINTVGTSNAVTLDTDGATAFAATTAPTDALKVIFVATGTDGVYNIYGTNVSGYSSPVLIGCTGTDEASTVTYYPTASSAQNSTWTVAENTTTETMSGDKPYFSICVGSTSQSWNPYGDSTTAKLYRSSNNNSNWNFIPANDAALASAASKLNEDFKSAAPTGYKLKGMDAFETTVATVKADGYTYAFADAVSLISNFTPIAEGSTEYVIDLADGYYYLESKATSRYEHLFNDDFYESNTDKLTLQSDSRVTTNNGIWKVTVNDNALTILNGQGTGITANNETNMITTLNVDPDDLNDGYYYFSEGINCTNSSLGSYRYTVTWTAGGYSKDDNRWKFVDASVAEANVYTVAIEGLDDATDAYVTYTNSSSGTEHAYAGGFFVIGSTPEVGSFKASAATGYSTEITVADNKITATYSINGQGYSLLVENAVAEAEAALALVGVGYPEEDPEGTSDDADTPRKTLARAIATAKTCIDGDATAEELAAIRTALSTYKAVTTNIQMPEDGKAYVFTNVHLAGTNHYINYTADGLTLVARGDGDANDLPMSAKFICRVLSDGRYAFVNNDGVYLTWRGSSTTGTNDGKGYVTAYDSDYCPMTFVRMPATGNATVGDLFGIVSFGGKRDASYSSNFVVTSGTTYSYNQNRSLSSYNYGSQHSTAFQVEEVDYPNNVTLNSTVGMNDEDMSSAGVNYIGTFSAPFATVLPENVNAYYVTQAADGVATVAKLADGAVPANTGVLLTSADQTSSLMVPATTETAATISNTNLLGNTAGADLTIADGNSSIYVLTKYNDRVAFYLSSAGTLSMNKAYLNLTASSAPQFTLSFGGKATGIGAAVSAEGRTAPVVYDLSGRRVTNAAKGLYIVNGKKAYVK